MKPLVLVLLLCLPLIVACVSAPTPIPTPTTAPLVKTPAVSLPDDVLGIYHKSGGIAGIDETLVAHHGGLLELTMRGGATKSVQADEAMIQPLRRMLEQKDFGELAPLYRAAGADLFTYVITARDASGNV